MTTLISPRDYIYWEPTFSTSPTGSDGFCSSVNRCFWNISNRSSVAVGFWSNGAQNFWSGNLASVKSGRWCVNGVHTPCTDGQFVCHNFRRRSALEFSFCVRIKSIHLHNVSSVKLRTHNQCRPPFKYSPTMTGWRWRRGFTYTTTPGFAFENSNNRFSRKSLLMEFVTFSWKNLTFFVHTDLPYTFAASTCFAVFDCDSLQLAHITANAILERSSRKVRFQK